MIINWIILLSGLVLLSAGMVVVLFSAFRSGQRAWGVGMVVLPLIYPLYAILHWAESRIRNGFLVSIVGSLLVAAAIYAGAANDLTTLSGHVPNKQLQKQVNEFVTKIPTAGPPIKPLPNDKEASKISFAEDDIYDPLHSGDEFANVEIQPLLPEQDEKLKVTGVAVIPVEYREIAVDELTLHHNKLLKLTTQQGEVKKGKLVESDHKSLSLEMPYEKGLVAFQYNFDNIDKLFISDADLSSIIQQKNESEQSQEVIGVTEKRKVVNSDNSSMGIR